MHSEFTISSTKLKAQSGVTLIELLVVIVLLGVAIALVGPFTVKQVDSAKARNEQLQLQRWLQKQSFNAFTSESPIFLRFDGKSVFRTLLPGSALYNQQLKANNDSQNLVDNADYGTGYGVEYTKPSEPSQPKFETFDDFLNYQQTAPVRNDKLIEPTLVFEHLFFEPQSLMINNHGYIDVASIEYHYRGAKTSLNLNSLLSGGE